MKHVCQNRDLIKEQFYDNCLRKLYNKMGTVYIDNGYQSLQKEGFRQRVMDSEGSPREKKSASVRRLGLQQLTDLRVVGTSIKLNLDISMPRHH